MVAFKKSKKKSKKTFKKKAKATTVLKNMVNMGAGFPKKLIVTQKYVGAHVFTSTGGALVNYQYALNGCYDTDITGVGHQPMYFDQYMALYNHYTVIGAKMIVEFTPYSAGQTPMNVALWQNDDTTIVPATWITMAEQTKSKAICIPSGEKRTLTLKWSARKTFGKPVMGKDSLQGTVSSNPTELSVGVISLNSADLTTSVNCIVNVRMEYIVCYEELKDMNSS